MPNCLVVKYVIVLLGITIHFWSCDNNDTTKVLILAGQSNMAGLGKLSDIDTFSIPDNFTFHDFGIHGVENSGSDRFGPEISLIQSLNKAFPKDQFQIIKYAVGGSSLLDWAPDYDPIKAEITGNARFGNMYGDLIRLVDSLVVRDETDMLGLLWMQGERDARIPEAGEDYYINFSKLIHSLRQDLGAESLPILFGEVNPPADRYAALDIVREAQLKISQEDPDCYIIETDDLAKLDDNLHYSSQGQIELGNRYAAVISNLFQ